MNVDHLLEQAVKKEYGWVFGWGRDPAEAGELYVKIANYYIVQNDHNEAHNYLHRAANCHVTAQNGYEAELCYRQAAKLKVSNMSKIRSLKELIDITTQQGQWNSAAKAAEDLSSLHEQLYELDDAISITEKALLYYSYSNAGQSKKRCTEKLAGLYTVVKQYAKAAEHYEVLIGEAESTK